MGVRKQAQANDTLPEHPIFGLEFLLVHATRHLCYNGLRGPVVFDKVRGVPRYGRPRLKGYSMKRAILFLSIGAIVAFIVGIVLAGAGATQASASSGSAGAGTLLALIGLILYFLGGLMAFVAWIMGIIATARIGRWGWFVLVLLISPLGSLIYGIAGPTERAVA